MLHRITTSCSTLLLFLISNASYSQIEFQRHGIFNELRGAYWVYAEDIDGDGDLDLVTAAFDAIDWWENDGAQDFTRHTIDTRMQGAWSAHADDMDNDGDIDVLACSPTDDEVVLWLNDGNQNFDTRIIIDSEGLDPETVITEDVDQDGDRDILAAHWESGHVVWYENLGSAEFERHLVDHNLRGAHSVTVADFNGDGDYDIAANGAAETVVYFNNGSQNFSHTTLSSRGGLVIHSVDLDQDGDVDILRNQRDTGDVDWFENLGNGLFTEHQIAAAFGDSWSIRTGDLDGDGDLDVVAAGFSVNHLGVWLNQGDNTFGEEIILNGVDTPRFVDVADLDGDRDEDIVAAIRDDRDLLWYEVLGSPPEPKTLTLTAPASGDTVLAGSVFEVTWQWTGEIDQVRIEFSADNGASWSTISEVANNGAFSWNVPNIFSQTCMLRLSGTDADEPSVQHDAPFHILRNEDLPPSLTLTAPNGGEAYFIDSLATITWTSTGPISQVNLELSTDNGNQWVAIATQAANDGVHSWIVPDIESDLCKIRVSNTFDHGVRDASDGVFAIERFIPPQEITVTAPVGGEALWADSLFTVSWETGGEISDIRIEFSADNGQTWSEVTALTPNTGTFAWTLPDTSSENCRLRLSDASDGDPSVLNPGVFSIRRLRDFAPTIDSFTPEFGPPGTIVTIHGSELDSVTDVRFNGQQAAHAIISDAQLEATVPNGATTGKIRLVNFAGITESDQPFEVRAGTETVTLTFQPTDDAQVKMDDPQENYGDKPSFKIELDQFASYLKFELTGLSGNIVQAGLRVTAISESVFGGMLASADNDYGTAPRPWREDSLTYANRPVTTGEPFDSLQTVVAGSVAHFNTTAVVNGDSIYSFVLTSRSDDQIEYYSKESAFPPELFVVVERQGNIAPYAVDDVVATLEDTPTILSVTGNDVDPDGSIDPSTLQIVAPPEHGSAAVNVDGTLLYAPEPDYFGPDSLRYTVRDDRGDASNSAVVRIQIQGVNDPPHAESDTVVALLSDSIRIAVLDNDSDIDGSLAPASIRILRQPELNAQIVINSNSGVVVYAPVSLTAGVDSFSYTVEDDSGAVSNEAIVTLTLQDGNQPPVAVNDTLRTPTNTPLEADVTSNDFDPEGNLDGTSVTVIREPQHGALTMDEDTGLITYVPEQDYEGQDSFTYLVMDVFGLPSNEAAASITVGPFNQPPSILSIQPQETRISSSHGEVISFAVVASDADGDALSYVWMLQNNATQEEMQVGTSQEFVMNSAEFEATSYTVSVEVSDGEDKASQSWVLDLVTSVELSGFRASFSEFEGVVLTWSTGRENANMGFNVLRSLSAEGDYTRINQKLLKPVSPGNYNFVDTAVVAGEVYYYRLEDVDRSGRSNQHQPLKIAIAAPETFEVSKNYPNPFNPATNIRFQLPEEGKVVFKVMNLLGQTVRTLLDERKQAGFHVVRWDGSDNSGRAVSSGIYYYHVSYNGQRHIGRMMLLK